MNRWLLSPALVRLAAQSVPCSSILAKPMLRLALLISDTTIGNTIVIKDTKQYARVWILVKASY
jgi:hypothetical protein